MFIYWNIQLTFFFKPCSGFFWPVYALMFEIFFGGSLVSGDVEGNLDKLFGRVNTIQKKSGSFDVGFISLQIYFCFHAI